MNYLEYLIIIISSNESSNEQSNLFPYGLGLLYCSVCPQHHIEHVTIQLRPEHRALMAKECHLGVKWLHGFHERGLNVAGSAYLCSISSYILAHFF